MAEPEYRWYVNLQYVEFDMTTSEIAEHCGVSDRCVDSFLRRYEVKHRQVVSGGLLNIYSAQSLRQLGRKKQAEVLRVKRPTPPVRRKVR